MAKNKNKYKVGGDIYETAEDERGSDNSYINAVDFSQLDKKLDKDSFFKPKNKKTHSFNVIPFIMKGENNPYIVKGKAEVGQAHYMLDIYIHNNIGPDNGSVVCLKQNYGQTCPCCDAYQELMDAAETDKDKKAASQIKAKRRAYMNIQLIEGGEPSDELLVWNAGHYRFMKEGILQEANACREGGEPVPFADPEDGCIIKMRCGHSDLSEKDITVERIDWVERDEEIDIDILEQAISFDEILVRYTAEELVDIMDGETPEDDAKDRGEKAEVEDEEEEAKTATKKSAKKKTTTKKSAKKSVKKVAKKKPEPEPEPEEAPEEEADPNEVCNYDMEFGADHEADVDVCNTCFDEHPHCWKGCMKAHEAEEE